ncbi:MAG: 6-phosphogluconolactonase [Gemmatimonadota bacterium]|nr:6-phosphogluconolactonase [Gemmatimonadota bacterium]
MGSTAFRVFPSPDAIGEELACRLLERIEKARVVGARFLLGCPTGRTPRPVYRALARRLTDSKQNIAHLVLVMMDEYLVNGDGGFEYAPDDRLWSCHHFVREEIAGPLNEALPPADRIRNESIWFPDPANPNAFDDKLENAGGIDFFILASGASDGHVAFNPPGSSRDSRTRIIQLSEATRRDNLQTFPAFRKLADVPTRGISVGIGTIASAREAVMIVWGGGKRVTLSRMLSAQRYEPDWPATVIHECMIREIWGDTEAVRPSDAG